MISFIIVEDEYLERELIKRSFDWEGNGFRLVGEAGDGEEGLALFKQSSPDLVITDINMPYMNGIEFAKKVRGLSQTAELIILTGYDEFTYAKSAVSLGVFAFLLKPINRRELEETLLEFKGKFKKARQDREHTHQVEQMLEKEVRYILLQRLISGQLIGEELALFLEQSNLTWLHEEFFGVYFDTYQSQADILFLLALLREEEKVKTLFFDTVLGGTALFLPVKSFHQAELAQKLSAFAKAEKIKIGISKAGKGAEKIPDSFLQADTVISYLKDYQSVMYDDLASIIEADDTLELVASSTPETYLSSLTKRAVLFINENYCDAQLTLTVIASALYVNDSYLSRLFKEETGLGVIEYITTLRMQKAAELLHNTDLKNYEIAEEIGINDPHYFGQCFKKHYGMTASNFRKKA